MHHIYNVAKKHGLTACSNCGQQLTEDNIMLALSDAGIDINDEDMLDTVTLCCPSYTDKNGCLGYTSADRTERAYWSITMTPEEKLFLISQNSHQYASINADTGDAVTHDGILLHRIGPTTNLPGETWENEDGSETWYRCSEDEYLLHLYGTEDE